MIATPANPALPTHLQTVDEFEQWERQHPHEGSYEFVRGRIIPKPAMKQDEIFIASFLTRLFYKTTAFQQGNELLPETDSYVDGARKRVPDLMYITADQHQAIRRGERVNTLFGLKFCLIPNRTRTYWISYRITSTVVPNWYGISLPSGRRFSPTPLPTNQKPTKARM